MERSESSKLKRKSEENHDESRSKKKKKSKKPKNLPITAMLNARSTASTGTSDTKNQPAKKNKTKSQKKKHHQQLITKFHTSIKNLETAKEQGDESRINSIEEEIESLGGLRFYQKMSIRGEKLHSNYNTSKWIRQQLKEFKVQPKDKSSKLKLLDVGALDFHYKDKWIEAIAIDLNSNHSQVLQKDFFELQSDESLQGPYDVICLSLVVNFVGDPKKRGDMLIQATELLVLNGHLFLILPLPCVTNSRYFSHELLLEMMESLGYNLITHHHSKRLAHYMFQKAEVKQRKIFKRDTIRKGTDHNNFCIVMGT